MENFVIYSPLIGFACFLLGGLFLFVWPKSRAKEIKTLHFPNFVLHYFHPLAWELVGMGVFMYVKYPNMAIVFIGLGILAFAMFLYIWLRR